jgi:L-iditol 2-dehydrogenase
MRAALARSLDDVELVELPDPEPGPGEVVCRVLACGVCGSDVLPWYVERKLPAVLGHEPAGEVVAVGDGVDRVAPGDRVAIHHHVPCGRCDRCRRGRETMCATFRASGLEPGGFAEQVRIPAELTHELLPLDGLDPVLASFTEPLACVWRALDRARIGPGDRVLVVGAGTSGLLAVAATRARDVEAVYVQEPRSDRRALAEALGARPHEGEGVHAALACTPRPEAIAAALEPVEPGGVLLLYAPPAPGTPLGLDGAELFLREIDVRPSYSAGPADMRAALTLLQTGTVDPRPLVTHVLGLDEVARGLALQRSGEALKAVIVP